MSARNILLVLIFALVTACSGKGTKEEEGLGYGTLSGAEAAGGAQSGGVGDGTLARAARSMTRARPVRVHRCRTAPFISTMTATR